MNPWSERKMLRESLAVSRAIVAEQRDTIADLERKLANHNEADLDLLIVERARAKNLLAQVYQLQAEIVRLRQELGRDCRQDCFTAYGQKRFYDVCDDHLDEIGRELSNDSA